MRNRADRRAARNRIANKWIIRIRARWGKRLHSRFSALTEEELRLKAVVRTETHEDLRNHPRKSCNRCNPVFRRLKQEKALKRDLDQELELLDVNLHDLLRPTPD
jgi:hypothetical protein